MKKLSFSRSLVCVSLLALLSAGASAAEKVTLKLAHNLERSHVVHQAFEQMAKEVNQLSNGNMKIRIYPSSQMGSARETMELLQNGALDMTKGSASDLHSLWQIGGRAAWSHLITSTRYIIYRSCSRIRITSIKSSSVKWVKK